MIFFSQHGRIYYEVHGNGKPILIIHGLGGSSDSMRMLSDRLQGYQRVLVDLPCHGFSDDFKITLDDLSKSLNELMNSLGYKKFYVIGISLGAIISEIITLKYPANIIKSVFISPASHIDDIAINMVSSWVTSEDGGASTLFSPDYFASHKEEILEYDKLHPLQPERLLPIIPEITKFNINGERSTKNCVILYGKYDDLFGKRMIDSMLNIFPNCSVYELSTGHSIHRENPQAAADIIMKELAKNTVEYDSF